MLQQLLEFPPLVSDIRRTEKLRPEVLLELVADVCRGNRRPLLADLLQEPEKASKREPSLSTITGFFYHETLQRVCMYVPVPVKEPETLLTAADESRK